MTLTEYARYRGCSIKTIQKWVAEGTIPFQWVGSNKKIHPESADADVGPPGKKGPPTKERTQPALTESKAKKEKYLAKMARLEYLKTKKELIEAKAAQKAVWEWARRIRDSILNVPGKIDAEVASCTDPYKVNTILRKELELALTELSKDPTDKD